MSAQPIGPFSLQDVFWVLKLDRAVESLCPMEALTHPRPVAWRAIASLFAFEEAQTLTFVFNDPRRDGKGLRGFIQAVRSLVQPEMYIQSLAPGLGAGEGARMVWSRLLNHMVAAGGERGVERLFVCAADASSELEVLLEASFNVYAREQIFHLPPDVHPQVVVRNGIRPEQSTDSWGIRQLYRTVTPHLVQQAEPLGHDPHQHGVHCPVSWQHGEGFVLEGRDGIVGYGHLTPGHIGHWLSFLIHPQAYDRASELLDYGLALLSYYPPYPVYCGVREYQGGVCAHLEARGFDLLSAQCCLVKHTTVRVKEAVVSLVPALEKSAKAPTTTVSSGDL